jgi:transcriptional regulator with XRE-family HTH domain
MEEATKMGLFDRTVSVRREEVGLSQTELAARVGVSQQTVSRWEGGTAIPQADRVIALARVLDLEEDRLLGYAGFIPKGDRSQYWGQFRAMYENLVELSDQELILLLDKAWQEHRRRQGFEAPKEPPSDSD